MIDVGIVMRKKGIVFYSEYGKDERSSVLEIKNAGFDSVMLGWCGKKEIERIASLCQKAELTPEIIHAPFSHINEMWLNGSDGDYILDLLCQNVITASECDIPYVVVHLSSGENAPHLNDLGISRFEYLVNTAVKHNVTVAFENQRKLANIAYMMERYKDCPNVGFCWDNGHEACFTEGREYMPLFGNKLVCTHIHDNFAQKNGDLHLMPFDGCYDFNRYAEHIKKSGYTGTLLLETSIFSGDYHKMTPRQFLNEAYKRVSMLADMCDKA